MLSGGPPIMWRGYRINAKMQCGGPETSVVVAKGDATQKGWEPLP